MKWNNHVHHAEEDSEECLAGQPIRSQALRAIEGDELVLYLVEKRLGRGKDWVHQISVDRTTANSQIVSLDSTAIVHLRRIMSAMDHEYGTVSWRVV